MPKLSIDIFSEFKYMYNAVDLAFTVGSILGAFLVNAKHSDTKKIGRASCRERVLRLV